MPFQMRDETAGINILYINNAGQCGLGTLPSGNQQLALQGMDFLDQFGNLAPGLLGPGSQNGYEGSLAPGGTIVVVTTVQLPQVTSTEPPTFISTTQVSWSASGSPITYSIW